MTAAERQAKRRAAISDLIAAAESAADWMCEAHEGTDQWERGQELRAALKKMRGR